MIKSTIDSIVKLPLEIPRETDRPKKEREPRSLAIRIEPDEEELQSDIDDLKKTEASLYPKGYIKYPAYDFF